MGGCFSKKNPSSGVFSSSKFEPNPTNKPNFSPDPRPIEEVRTKTKATEVGAEKEESLQQQNCGTAMDGIVTVSSSPESVDKNVITSNTNFNVNGTDSAVCSTPAAVRTSSCTKEEVDAILIQCGRLSQVASGSGSAERSRKFSGHKRSYDFDHNDADAEADGGEAEERRLRERNRQSGDSPQGRRRRTPSREREHQNQRSNSKERSRRVSRSPGKRSVNSSAATNVSAPSVAGNSNSTGGANGVPGKMVSVPATVSSLGVEKGNNGCGEPGVATAAVKRINVKRNAASPRARSPAGTRASGTNENSRAQSPARGIANGLNENVRARSPARTNANGFSENQQSSLSCNVSRKAEQSPYRRHPLSEIDPNSLAYPQPAKTGQTNADNSSRVHVKSKEFEADGQLQKSTVGQGPDHKISSRGTLENKVMNVSCSAKEQHQQQQILEEAKEQTQVIKNVVPQTLTRSRSSRRSQDLDLNLETLLNPNPSYTSLLLEDIHNFHQKSALNSTSFPLPPCVTKAHSILEAVADLNGSTGSALSGTFSNERMRLPTDQFSITDHILPSATILAGNKRAQYKDPFVESEVIVNDHLMEPSLHKYVTVRSGRGSQLGGKEIEEEESSGSNSYAGGGGQHWGVSSSWEPNSADSTDHWTSRSNTKENYQNSLESGHPMEENRKEFSGKRRGLDNQQTGVGYGKVGGSRGPQAVVVSAST